MKKNPHVRKEQFLIFLIKCNKEPQVTMLVMWQLANIHTDENGRIGAQIKAKYDLKYKVCDLD